MLALSAVLALSACKQGPDFASPTAPGENGYTGADEALPGDADTNGKTGPAQRVKLGAKVEAEWWHLFHSPALDRTVKQALAESPTIAQARATLTQAHEQANATAGGLLPQIDLSAGIDRQAINVQVSGTNRSAVPVSVFSIGPTVNYALDVFGGIKRQVEAQVALADVSDYQLGAAYLSLSGNITLQAVTIASLRAQIATVEDILTDDQKNLDLVKTTLAAGTASLVDVTAAQSQLDGDRTLLPPLHQELSVARHALVVFVGKTPADWTPPDFDLANLTLPADLPVSLPSQLVRQRPDILAAEAQLHAASAEVGVATANLYPNFSLTAAFGQDATQLTNYFSGAYSAWNFGANMAAPIFHGGTLRAQQRAAIAAFDASREAYRQTVIQAFGQVADFLEALTHDAQSVASQRQAVATAQEALRLARLSYQNGNSTLLFVLQAERLSQQAQLGVVQSEGRRFLDTAQLFVALGSGWWDTPPTTLPATTPPPTLNSGDPRTSPAAVNPVRRS
ncbi:MAG TPA: efflux transporter outer membrane subunit [Stellaceae bacterium]|nr:efflux transporter outer membrane subunit [Stellaceae bacterium]